MSFGYSAGDFILLTQLCWNVVQNSRIACGAHDDLTREVTSLHVVLRRLQLEISKPGSLLSRTEDSRHEELAQLSDDCRRILRVLERILEKYNALSEEKRSVTKLWKRIQFGNGEMQDLADLRLKISAYTSALTLFLNLLGIGSQGRVESYLEEQGGELRQMRSSLNWITANLQAKADKSEGSVLTNYAGDDKRVWKEFRRELVKEGFSSDILRQHKKTIQNYIMELGNRGALDDVIAEEGEELDGEHHFEEEPQHSSDEDIEDEERDSEETAPSVDEQAGDDETTSEESSADDTSSGMSESDEENLVNVFDELGSSGGTSEHTAKTIVRLYSEKASTEILVWGSRYRASRNLSVVDFTAYNPARTISTRNEHLAQIVPAQISARNWLEWINRFTAVPLHDSEWINFREDDLLALTSLCLGPFYLGRDAQASRFVRCLSAGPDAKDYDLAGVGLVIIAIWMFPNALKYDQMYGSNLGPCSLSSSAAELWRLWLRVECYWMRVVPFLHNHSKLANGPESSDGRDRLWIFIASFDKLSADFETFVKDGLEYVQRMKKRRDLRLNSTAIGSKPPSPTRRNKNRRSSRSKLVEAFDWMEQMSNEGGRRGLFDFVHHFLRSTQDMPEPQVNFAAETRLENILCQLQRLILLFKHKCEPYVMKMEKMRLYSPRLISVESPVDLDTAIRTGLKNLHRSNLVLKQWIARNTFDTVDPSSPSDYRMLIHPPTNDQEDNPKLSEVLLRCDEAQNRLYALQTELEYRNRTVFYVKERGRKSGHVHTPKRHFPSLRRAETVPFGYHSSHIYAPHPLSY